ncbi:MAG: hypothetical protein PHT40_04390 [Patescibacteria group bacterium]|nr:hypothetical protein [Patescibacteria group bacterium]
MPFIISHFWLWSLICAISFVYAWYKTDNYLCITGATSEWLPAATAWVSVAVSGVLLILSGQIIATAFFAASVK